MATEQFDRLAKTATESLGKLQQFDPNTVARVEELGPGLSFLPAVEPVRKLISFWQLINPAGLGDLSQTALRNIVERAESDLLLLERFKTFSVNDGVNARAQIIAEAENSFDATFDRLHSQAGFTASRRF